jgi:hypothetical protein
MEVSKAADNYLIHHHDTDEAYSHVNEVLSVFLPYSETSYSDSLSGATNT